MLSILIPTYNYDCYELTHELYQQAKLLNIPFEIIVADDASREEMKTNNRKINLLSYCRYIELPQNLGRAKIRNFLGNKAIYTYLLFLDSDVRICRDDFLHKYIIYIKENLSEETASRKIPVICGSTLFRRRTPEANKTLRYTYGITREEKNSEECNKKPYAQFTSINFLIRKETFHQIRFNERFTQYGHEDTLFGKELELAKIPVIHIDNPIYHEVPDTNQEFLNKTRRSIENSFQYKEILYSHVHLLQVYEKIKKAGLRPLLFFMFKLCNPFICRNLCGSHPNMKFFSFYKLGYLCFLEHKNDQKKVSGSLRAENFS